MLCRVVLCCAVLCCIVSYCVVLCRTISLSLSLSLSLLLSLACRIFYSCIAQCKEVRSEVHVEDVVYNCKI